MKKKNQKKGFTLIEMLVVIVIIGILAAMIVVNVASGRRKALAARAAADVQEIDKAIQLAISEGCRSIKVSADGDIGCTVPSTLTRTYARASKPTSGMTYTIAIGAGTATNASGAATWTLAGSLGTGISVSGGYYAAASGGFKTATDDFECSDGGLTGHTRPGCFCGRDGGCEETS